ncbi:hypothetical protein Trydic_g9279 [Trypoxylus dichotomus]
MWVKTCNIAGQHSESIFKKIPSAPIEFEDILDLREEMFIQKPLLHLATFSVFFGLLHCESASTASGKHLHHGKDESDTNFRQGHRPAGFDVAQKSPDDDDVIGTYGDDSLEGFPFDEEGEVGDDFIYVITNKAEIISALLISEEYLVSKPPTGGKLRVCLNVKCESTTVQRNKGDFVILRLSKKRKNVEEFIELDEGKQYDCEADYESKMMKITREKDKVKCEPPCEDGMVLACDRKAAGLVRVKGDVAKLITAVEMYKATLEREVPAAEPPQVTRPPEVEKQPVERGEKTRSTGEASTVTVSMFAIGFVPAVFLLLRA